MRAVKRRRATRDIDEHAANIASHNPRTAYRFLEMVEVILDVLGRHQRIGSPRFHHTVSGLRAFPVRSFESHIALYFFAGGRVQAVRVVHGASDLEELLEGPWT